MDYICNIPSPVGLLTLSSDGQALTGLWLEGQKYFAATLGGAAESRPLPIFEEAQEWLQQYFSGKQPECTLPLAPKGSPFRKAVWDILLAIPYGQVMTYGEIAARLNERADAAHTSPRAVGGAVGHNPISILIPCHRVVGSGGSLTGYAGGIEKKIQLLKLEGAPMEHLFIPAKGGQ